MSGPLVSVYSRRGCHLCELLLEELLPLTRDRARVEVLNVDDEPDWQRQFGTRVPVVAIGGRVICELKLDVPAVLVVLAELAKIGAPRAGNPAAC